MGTFDVITKEEDLSQFLVFSNFLALSTLYWNLKKKKKNLDNTCTPVEGKYPKEIAQRSYEVLPFTFLFFPC